MVRFFLIALLLLQLQCIPQEQTNSARTQSQITKYELNQIRQLQQSTAKTIEFGVIYHESIKLNEVDEDILQTNKYLLQIKKDDLKDDIIFIAKGKSPQDDPDIFIGFTNEDSANLINSEIQCTSQGMDICTIPKEKITDHIYIAILCPRSCSYSIRALYVSEKTMSTNDNLNLQIDSKHQNTQSARIITIKTPSNITEMENLNIQVQLEDLYTKGEGFMVLLTEGPQIPTTSKYDIKGQDVAFGIKLIQLHKYIGEQKLLFKPSTDYKILIEAPSMSYVEVKTFTSSSLREVQIFDLIWDVVEANRTKNYIFNLKDDIEYDSYKNMSLIFILVPYSGSPGLYIDVSKQPPTLKKYTWHTKEQGNQQILITRKELDLMKVKKENEMYYITVHSALTSTYSLTISQQGNDKYIKFDTLSFGSLVKGEIQNFKILTQYKRQTIIYIDVTNEVGHVQLYVKYCPPFASYDCQISRADIEDQDDSTMEDLNDKDFMEHMKHIYHIDQLDQNKAAVEFDDTSEEDDSSHFFRQSLEKGTKQISFFYDYQKCSFEKPEDNQTGVEQNQYENQFENQCNFVFGLYAPLSSKNVKKLNTYTVLITHTISSIQLQESTPYEVSLQLNQVKYFSFVVPQADSKAFSVQIQINNLQGFTETFSSKTVQQPDKDHRDKETVFDLISYDKNHDKDLSGNYYISVKGLTQSVFIITPVILRQDSQIVYVSILPGQPVKNTIEQAGDTLYFKFEIENPNLNSDINNYEDHLPAVNINFQKIQGEFNAYVTVDINKGDPSKSNFIWKLQGGTLHIKPDDTYYSQTYYISVQARRESEYTNETESLASVQKIKIIAPYQFKLSYQTSNIIQKLIINDAEYSYIHTNQTLNYKIEVKLGEDIQITKYSFSDNAQVNVYISIDQEIEKPDMKSYSYLLSENDKAYTFTSEDLTFLKCDFLLNLSVNRKCYVFLGVQSNNETYFSLMASKSENIFLIYDGIPTQIGIPTSKNQGIHLYYHVPKTLTPIKIYEHNYVLQVDIYMNVFQYKDGMPQIEWPFPTPKSNDVTSIQKTYVNINSFTVQPESLKEKGCFGNTTCIIALLILPKIDETYQTAEELEQFTLSLQISSLITKLKIGKAQVGSLHADQLIYYQFQNFQNESILISLTSLSNSDVMMFVSKGQNKLPDQENKEWETQYYRENEIIITYGSKDSVINTTAGIYNIGLYSPSDLEFQLQVVTGASKYYHIMPSYPQRAFSEKNTKSYFLYSTYQEGEFKVLISKLSGNLYITVYSQKPYISIKDFFDSKSKLMSNTNQNDQYTEIISVTKNASIYCVLCTYIIEVSATQASDYSVIIELKNQPIILENNKILKNQLDTNEEHQYAYYGSSDFNYQIKVTQGSLTIYTKTGYQITKDKYDDKKTCDANKKCSFTLKTKKVDYCISLKQNNIASEVTFLIVAQALTIYSIQAFGESYIQQIEFGQPEIFSLQVEEVKRYHILYKNDTQKQGFSVALQLTNFQGIQDYSPQVTIYRDTNFNQNGTAPHDLSKAQIVKQEIMNNNVLYEVHESQGMFVIEISNNKEKSVHLGLTLDFVLTLLFPYLETLHFTPVGRIQGFELYSPEQSKVLVEVQQCYGLVSVFATQIKQNLLEGVSELLSTRIYTDRQQILFTMQHPGIIFIGVRGISGEFVDGPNMHNSLYIVKAKIYSLSQTIPLDKFVPGSNGRILWKFDGLDFLISFEKVEPLEDLNNLIITSYEYFVTYHDDPTSNKNYCQNTQIASQTYNNTEHKLLTQITLKTSQQLPNQYNTLLVKVGVHVHLRNFQGDKEVVKLNYDTEQINNYSQLYERHSNRHYRWIYNTIFFLFVVCLIFSVVYLVRRVRKLKARLDYQMTDVRNIASMDSYRDSNKEQDSGLEMNYKGLGEGIKKNKQEQL